MRPLNRWERIVNLICARRARAPSDRVYLLHPKGIYALDGSGLHRMSRPSGGVETHTADDQMLTERQTDE